MELELGQIVVTKYCCGCECDTTKRMVIDVEGTIITLGNGLIFEGGTGECLGHTSAEIMHKYRYTMEELPLEEEVKNKQDTQEAIDNGIECPRCTQRKVAEKDKQLICVGCGYVHALVITPKPPKGDNDV